MCAFEFAQSLSRKKFCHTLQRLVPDLRSEDLETGGSGVRAQGMLPNGSLVASPWLAFLSLAFLVGVHKLEYFLNAHIVGTRIRVPTLIIHAADDPIIPSEPLRDPSIAGNPEVLLVLTARGGHVGFVADATEGEDRYWAENRVVEFCRMLADERQK